MKKILLILALLCVSNLEAQIRNPLIPSKRNDRLLAEQDAANRRAEQLKLQTDRTQQPPRAKEGSDMPSSDAGGTNVSGSTDTQDLATPRPPKKGSGEDPGAESPRDSAILAAKLPTNDIVTTAEYDPEHGCYIMHTKIGDAEVSTPYMLTEKEYRSFSEQETMHSYWREKIGELGHSNERKFDITDLKFNIGPADKIFGPGGVQLKLQGSAELLFGFKHQYVGNPSLTQRTRNNNIFDFDEKIQLSVNGKVGEKVDFNLNYNTEASFSFDQQNLKLAYKGKEDDIIQSLEAGNVTLDLNSSLIQGSKALFGVKTNLQFGKLKVQALVSQQNSESKTVSSKGGAQMTSYEVGIQNYDENRHFFLSYFFRDKYESAMKTLPVVASGVTITKIEVWVTNKRASYDNSRNIVAFVDLGETKSHRYNIGWSDKDNTAAANHTNDLYELLSPQIRDISQVGSLLSGMLEESADYEKIESARLLNASEYTLNSALGYISLKAALTPDEVLAVAYEYTYNGRVYQVGEFTTDVNSSSPNATTSNPALVTKLLKTNGSSPDKKGAGTWDLMMKNVYSLGATSITQENFTLDICYRNDSVGTEVQYLSEGSSSVKGKPLIRVMGLDRLDSRHNPYADGLFDYVEGYTVNSATGRIYFPVLEPFGSNLAEQLGDPKLAEKYIFQELYDSTLVNAEEMTEKNKFVLKGKYSGSAGNQISLGAMNVPKGSVVVTAGGATLVENVDYTVDYISGIVTIINQSILDSGTNISVSLENQATFSMTRKTVVGAHLEYNFTPDFVIGGTILHMSERPLTTKVNTGSEPIANTIWGLNLAWRTELPWINSAINAIPWMKAEAPSSFSINGEFAHLIPGHTSEVGKAGTAYIDDFENTKTDIDVHTASAWHLASTPVRYDENKDVNQASYNKNRALLSWYTVDPIFGYPMDNTPPSIKGSADAMSDHRNRIIYEQEIYPNRENLSTDDTRLNALSLSYYPEERGPYNVSWNELDMTTGNLKNPRQRWGGMMRRLDNTDFEKSNIEYIEFWLMDPQLTNPDHPNDYHVKLYINLGDINEDVLRDGKKSFEHGLPTSDMDVNKVEATFWGLVPKTNSTVNAFSNESGSRKRQDVGLDGLSNEQEKTDSRFPYKAYRDTLLRQLSASVRQKWAVDSFSPLNDPAGDRYHYYRGTDYDREEKTVMERYKYINNPEGNSPSLDDQAERYGTAMSLQPDVEDITMDNTLSTSDKYYEYCIEIDPSRMEVGQQHIASDVTSRVMLRNNEEAFVRWFQFKIPIKGQIGDSIRAIGGIKNLKSIRTMRVYLTDATTETHLRFGSFNLVRGEWRNYNKSLAAPGQSEKGGSTLDVQAINIEENGKRTPINYILPPGISRQTDPGQAQLIAQNEQAMVLKVLNLANGDARAVYKGTNFDMRNYKRMQMFVHAERVKEDENLQDGDLSCFIRLGSDLRSNYYQYEIPLKLTDIPNPEGSYNGDKEEDRYKVWPIENYFDFPLSVFTDLKVKRNKAKRAQQQGVSLTTVYSDQDYANDKPANTVSIVGNPSLENIEYILIGVRNVSTHDGSSPRSGEIWVNEMRLSQFNEQGGVAAQGNASLAISDIAQFNVSGRLETAGYGGLESNVLSRNMEDVYQIQLSAALEAGRLFPEKAKLQIPLYVSYSSETTSPQYDPLDTDMKLSESLESCNTKQEKDSVKNQARTVNKTTSFSASNVKLNIHSKKKDMFYDPANFSISASYNKQEQHSPDIEKNMTTNHQGSFTYSYNFNPQPWEPGKKSKSKSKFVKEFNLYYLPQSWGFSTTMHRQFTQAQRRELTGTLQSQPVDMASWSRDFTWDRNFNFAYNLTKNMKFSLQTAMNSTIDEGLYTPEIIRDYLFSNDYYEAWKDTIQRSLAKWGSPYTYQQVFTASWNVPFNRIPYLEALTANASYNANYNWARTQSSVAGFDYGNTVSSIQSWQIDGGLNLESLYQKSKYWKDMTQFYQGRARSRAFKSKTYTQTVNLVKGEETKVNHRLGSERLQIVITDSLGNRINVRTKVDGANAVILTSSRDYSNAAITITSKDPNKRDGGQVVGDMFAYLGTMIRKVQVTYRNTNSLSVPGFSPEIGFFGQKRMKDDHGVGYAPGWDFAFGFIPDDFLLRAKERGWLSGDTTVIQPATQSRTSDLDIRLTLEPLPGLKVQVSGKRYTSQTNSTIYSYGTMQDNMTGSFNITQVALATLFNKIGTADDNYSSKTYDQFLLNRDLMQARVEQRYSGYSRQDGQKYAVNRNSSDVLVPAFLAAYTGRNIDRMAYSPILGFLSILPNWSATYDGLSKLPKMKEYFRSFSITHAYTCKYNIGSYSSFATWQPAELNDKGLAKDQTLGFVQEVTTGELAPSSAYNITNVTLTESFSPLIGVNMTLKNSMSLKGEYRKQRNLALNVTSVQLTEGHTDELVIGAGYTIKDVGFTAITRSGGQKKVNNDLKLSVDVSYKNIKTFMRKIDEGIAQTSSGNQVFTIKVAADYVLSQKINLQFYYDHESTTPLLSTSYPIRNDNVGINIKLMLTR